MFTKKVLTNDHAFDLLTDLMVKTEPSPIKEELCEALAQILVNESEKKGNPVPFEVAKQALFLPPGLVRLLNFMGREMKKRNDNP